MKILRIPLVIVLVVVAGRAFNAGAQTLTTLYSFGSNFTDGSFPYSGLVQGSDSNLYGTTSSGGTNSGGTIFRISPSGHLTNLWSFGGFNGDDSLAGLVQGTNGYFYGTTREGGENGLGTIFRISSGGSYTNLYSFGNKSTDGYYPDAGLVQGSDGYFYGTTQFGGTNDVFSNGDGTVFRISPSGSETNLHTFVGAPTDGNEPYAGLVQGSDGSFYGTTYTGGTNFGTVYRIASSGSETKLRSFVGSPNDGANPQAGLVLGSDGNFYGTCNGGGTSNRGTVFRISPSGSSTNLYSFAGSPNDGANPQAGLVQGSDGNFYGTTSSGGTSNFGTVFQISPGGSYTNLYFFGSHPKDGIEPLAGLVLGSDGNFYGTTYSGGTSNRGTVFRLSIPLSPPPYPINQITGVQRSGTNVVFTIPSIAGETYQLQFSSSMNPTNWVNVPVSVTNSIGALLTLTNFGGASQPQGFYRFDVTP